ncbi:hypothetical protein [Cystobacter fuscus]|uniref:hypothetical protein n=1 Tax=Cystobacter fuscus TaxID=43 RepID=UPI0012FE53A9|nr:hypothetical protein [Cystobacter fuscus]
MKFPANGSVSWEAAQLYTCCIRKYVAAGERDVAAHLRMNLSELRAGHCAGTHLEDLQAGIDAARERLEATHSPAQQDEARLSRPLARRERDASGVHQSGQIL